MTVIKSNKILASPIEYLYDNFLKQLRERKLDSPKIILMNKPFNLSLTDDQADTYIKTIEDEIFKKQIYYPFKKLLKKQTENILAKIEGDLDFIDLGPGYPDKTLPLLQYLSLHCNSLRYMPVDISKHFLDITIEFMKKYSYETIPLNCLFEELPQIMLSHKIFREKRVRLFNIGFTFNNYPSRKIFSLFKKYLANNSVGLIATETINDDITKALEPYKTKKAEVFNFMILQNIGFEQSSFKYFVNYKNSCIEMGFDVKKDIEISKSLSLKRNDKIITSISYRYPKEYFIKLVNRHFPKSDFFWAANSNICLVKIIGEG